MDIDNYLARLTTQNIYLKLKTSLIVVASAYGRLGWWQKCKWLNDENGDGRDGYIYTPSVENEGLSINGTFSKLRSLKLMEYIQEVMIDEED